VHFQDYPELQGLWLPEWSHLAARDAARFTEALYAIVERDVEHHSLPTTAVAKARKR
jgi:hypothetical protein